jgi:Ser/Thr protein kinase RdoA (MazF antagonist)
MEKSVKNSFSPAILQKAFFAFNLDPNHFIELDGFENFLFESEIEGNPAILRLSHSSKKSRQMVESELSYVNFLSKNGAYVATPFASRNQKLTEIIPLHDGAYFTAVCFQKAIGIHPHSQDFDEHLLHVWGASLGKMHRLSMAYQPERADLQRIHWDEEIEVTQPQRFLPTEQFRVIEQLEILKTQLRTYPIDKSQYGIIHNDLHPYNFLYDGEKITMIDFEDCVQMWFVSDLAISMFLMTVWPADGYSREEFAMKIFPTFLAGYKSEKELPDEWLETMPTFLKFREIGQYIAMYRGADLDNPEPWVARFMDGRRERIELGLPYLELNNWSRFAT